MRDLETQMPLGVLEIVNSNTGSFDLDAQYIAFLVAEFAGYVINSLNNDLRRRKNDHARNELNAFAIKLFGSKKLSNLNSLACMALK